MAKFDLGLKSSGPPQRHEPNAPFHAAVMARVAPGDNDNGVISPPPARATPKKAVALLLTWIHIKCGRISYKLLSKSSSLTDYPTEQRIS